MDFLSLKVFLFSCWIFFEGDLWCPLFSTTHPTISRIQWHSPGNSLCIRLTGIGRGGGCLPPKPLEIGHIVLIFRRQNWGPRRMLSAPRGGAGCGTLAANLEYPQSWSLCSSSLSCSLEYLHRCPIYCALFWALGMRCVYNRNYACLQGVDSVLGLTDNK